MMMMAMIMMIMMTTNGCNAMTIMCEQTNPLLHCFDLLLRALLTHPLQTLDVL